MKLFGIATAITGKLEKPIFHCNTVSVDLNKVAPVSETREAELKDCLWKQRRLAREVSFEKPEALCFSDPISCEGEIKKAATNFSRVLFEVIEKQNRASELLPVILGQDARQGQRFYPWRQIRGDFVKNLDPKVLKQLNQMQFHNGNFVEVRKNRKSEAKPNPNLLSVLKEELATDAHILTQGTNDEKQELLEFYKKIAIEDAIKFFPHLYTGGTMRFFGFADFGLKLGYLSLHEDIEREFVDQIRLMTSVIGGKYPNTDKKEEINHFFVTHGLENNPPFTDVIKTYLLDLIAEDEDGFNRISNTYNEKTQRRIQRIIEGLSPNPNLIPK